MGKNLKHRQLPHPPHAGGMKYMALQVQPEFHGRCAHHIQVSSPTGGSVCAMDALVLDQV